MMMTDNDAARDELHNTTCHKFELWHRQLHAYNFCLRDYGARHQFMGEQVGGWVDGWSGGARAGWHAVAGRSMLSASSTSIRRWIILVLMDAGERRP
jgi:hypothetical protein